MSASTTNKDTHTTLDAKPSLRRGKGERTPQHPTRTPTPTIVNAERTANTDTKQREELRKIGNAALRIIVEAECRRRNLRTTAQMARYLDIPYQRFSAFMKGEKPSVLIISSLWLRLDMDLPLLIGLTLPWLTHEVANHVTIELDDYKAQMGNIERVMIEMNLMNDKSSSADRLRTEVASLSSLLARTRPNRDIEEDPRWTPGMTELIEEVDRF